MRTFFSPKFHETAEFHCLPKHPILFQRKQIHDFARRSFPFLSLSLCLFFFSLLYDARSPEPLNNSIPTSSRFLPRFILRQVLVSKAHDNFIPSRAFLVLPIHRIAWSFINPRCTLYLKKISIFPCERRVLLNLYIYTGCDNYLWMTTLLSSSFSSIKIQKNII